MWRNFEFNKAQTHWSPFCNISSHGNYKQDTGQKFMEEASYFSGYTSHWRLQYMYINPTKKYPNRELACSPLSISHYHVENKYNKFNKNYRNSGKAEVSATKNLSTMTNKIAIKFPSFDIYLTQITYSDNLTTIEKSNLDVINKTMLYLEIQQTQIHVIAKTENIANHNYESPLALFFKLIATNSNTLNLSTYSLSHI